MMIDFEDVTSQTCIFWETFLVGVHRVRVCFSLFHPKMQQSAGGHAQARAVLWKKKEAILVDGSSVSFLYKSLKPVFSESEPKAPECSGDLA